MVSTTMSTLTSFSEPRERSSAVSISMGGSVPSGAGKGGTKLGLHGRGPVISQVDAVPDGSRGLPALLGRLSLDIDDRGGVADIGDARGEPSAIIQDRSQERRVGSAAR